MRSERITSGTPDYKNVKNVVEELLRRFIEADRRSSSAHFEVTAKIGYSQNLLSGKQPWIQVAFATDGFPAQLKKGYLELNMGVGRSTMGLIPWVPDEWQSAPGGSWIVPLTDSGKLVCWIEEFLTAAAGTVDYWITGWTESE